MVDGHGKDLGVSFQGGKGVHRKRESDALDHAEPVIQAGAKTLHFAFLLRLRSQLVLHDDLHRLISSDTLVGACDSR